LVSNSELFTGDGTSATVTLAFYPISPLTLVSVNGTDLVENVGFTVDYATRIVTFTAVPADDAAIIINYNTNLTKTFDEVINSILAKLALDQTDITDFNIGSIGRNLVEAIAADIGSDSEEVDALYKKFLDVYESAFIDTATGTDLDEIVKLVGVTREPSDKAAGVVRFTRGALPGDILIAAGRVVATVASGLTAAVRYVTTTDVTLGAGVPTTLVPIEAEVAGTAGNAGIGAVTVIVTPITGIASVTNLTSIVGGTQIETDDALRDRAKSALDIAAKATEQAVTAAALAVDGVTQCNINDLAYLTVGEVVAYAGVALNALTNTPVNFIKQATGIVGGNPYTFIQGIDYQLSTNDIEFQIGGTDPDNPSNVSVDYEYELVGSFDAIVAGAAALSGAVLTNVADAIDDTKAAGIIYTLADASRIDIAVTCTVTASTGAIHATVQTAVETALITHLNSLDIGADVYLAKLYEVIMNVTDVDNVTIAAPAADFDIYDGEKATDGVITVNVV